MWQAGFSAFLVLTLVNGGLAQKAVTTNTSRNERVKRGRRSLTFLYLSTTLTEMSLVCGCLSRRTRRKL